ncbi:hypothetical protein CHX26_08960 [Porphyrobacter sp. HT-58-2]|uniref:hypothetical protein n=1 Tax=Porphyrobacter sp. HT-58-2 TaxID=2023229 RepID=UPI000CDC8853|nr:hypothetical protein [Porphyrobacter sp. HT-58-2]AUX69606.1 hypothetical protein CHX26_08960 [Porphyrobacter sp. HT-58-2]
MADIDVRKLADQLDAAQKILDEIRITSGCEAFGPPLPMNAARVERAVEAAQKALRDRQVRTDFVGNAEMFGEPAWDIMLDLFIRQAQDENVSIKAACMSPGAKSSTVLRWLNVLEMNDLVRCEADPSDSKRYLIRLTPAGYEGMLRYLETISA